MRADEYREKAADVLGLAYPCMETMHPIQIARAGVFALLAIAEELAALRAEREQRAGVR